MSLETFQIRHPRSVQGRFYVDWNCLDCELCSYHAPGVFVRDEDVGASYVARQPETDDEITGCLRAVAACPQENVHDDGLDFDWDAHPPRTPSDDE